MDKVIVLSSDEEEDSTYPSSAMRDEASPSCGTKCRIDEFDFDYGAALDYVSLSPEPEEVPSCFVGKVDSKAFGMVSGFSQSLSFVKLSPEPDKVENSPSSNIGNISHAHTRADQIQSRAVHDLSDSDEADEGIASIHPPPKIHSSDDELPDVNICSVPSRGVAKRNENLESKMSKNQKRDEQRKQKKLESSEKAKQRLVVQQERERKKREVANAKALKKASADIKRAQRPGECMKWVSAIVDPRLLEADCGGELLTALKDSKVDHKIEESIVPCSVHWERRLQNIHVGEDNSVETTTAIQREPFVLVVWMWNKIIEHIHDKSFESAIEDMISLLPGCEITLAIFGLEDYFRFQKTQKNRDVRSEVLGSAPQRRRAKEGTFEAAPTVSRGDVEFALAELQIVSNISHRCINTRKDLADLVCQFSKAIAQAPYKKGELQKFTERLDWYAVGDSKDCVVVDKDGNGSAQLWLRQLCQFPLASRETSEAIASVYPSPISLLMAYEECPNEEEAQSLLQDIPVRRGPGPLSTTRRIGPQLSRKIHTFFTTYDEACLIAPD